MTTENNNWQDRSEGGTSGAGREGYNRSRYNEEGRSEFSPRRNYRDFPREGGFRPRRNFDDNNRGFNAQNSYRKPYHTNEQEGFRPRKDNGDNAFRPRRNYGEQYGEGNFRPHNNEGEFSPRRSYGEQDHFRPRRNNEQDGYFRPRGNNDGEFRPRRNSGEQNGDGNFRPRRNNYDSNRNYGNQGNRFAYNRPHRSFGEPTLGMPNEQHADGRPKRPRIKKESTASGREWLAENNFKTPKHAPNLDPETPIRLNKFLSNAGICSRREADEYIQAGVVKVNGEIVTELGVKVLPKDEIMFHDQTVSIEQKVYILLNKPKDCVTTSEDPQERLTVMDLVKNACYERIYPVGRLDRNTTGVLLLTNDGDLASKLAHPKFEKRKIYQATLDKDLTEEDLQKVAAGIELDGEKIAVDEICYVNPEKQQNVIGIEIHSGQNRVVRRIFEQVGYKVYKLDRIYFAGLTKKNLPRGRWRHLTEKEVSLLKMGAFV